LDFIIFPLVPQDRKSYRFFKRIPIGEGRDVQLRFEGFNVFNIMNLAAPSGLNISTKAGLGAVTGIVGTPRQLQFGLRFVF